VKAFFLVPMAIHHACDYGTPGDEELRLTAIVLPANTQVTIDLVVDAGADDPLTASKQVGFGFMGEHRKKPVPQSVHNRFVHVGKGLDSGPDDYLDKHWFYHSVQDRELAPGNTMALGFRVATRDPGTYGAKIFFSSGWESENLTVTVV
jgi:hypothetical protein